MKQPSKNGYLSRNNVWTALWGNLWASIKYVIMVTSLSKSEASKITMYIYRETIFHIGAVKYCPVDFLNINPGYQGLGLPRIVLEQKNAHVYILSKNVSLEYLSKKVIILSIEHKKM